MGGTYRHQPLIEAPVQDVWAVVSDPRTHPEWWPDVVDVRMAEPLVEGGENLPTTACTPRVSAAFGGYVPVITSWPEPADTVG